VDGPLDAESAEWVRALSSSGADREAAIRRLHHQLAAAAHREARRRSATSVVTGRELDDLADQAADDATLAVLAKLPTFRGESRFSTWAYRFVVLELSHKLGRHYWRRTTPTDAHDWDGLPGVFGLDPAHAVEAAALVAAVRATVRTALTDRQRDVFVSAVVDGVPLDALAERLGVTRGAVYKGLYDARQALRAGLVADGYLEPARSRPRLRRDAGLRVRARLDAFLGTDPADVGCDEALRLLHVYVDLVRADRRRAESRYPGVVAHLAACGPCGDDFTGLLRAVSEDPAPLSGRRSPRHRPRSGR
jgi:RNA polymerase sigma-70 factor (ECF subfamily)